MMKKCITICAIFVFAWWFIALSYRRGAETVGPFDTKEGCKAKIS